MPIVKLNLKNLYRFFTKHPEGAWIMEWQNALQLYRFIKNHDIHRVLDLGTGIGLSSAVVSLAFIEKGDKNYRIDSIEQFDKCVKLADQLIPGELKPNLKIHKANPIIWQTPEIPYTYFSTYDKLPDGDYDLIINDGPGPFLENEKFIDLPNGTIHKLLLEGKIKPGTFVIYDGRVSSLKSLSRYFGHNFFLVPQPMQSDFNVLERKDNLVECLDDMLPNMERQGYFKDEQK